MFTHLVGERAAELNDLLTHGGFRRSQSIAYRPACETCRACVSVRVIVDEFEPTRSMRRVQQRNDDLIGDMRARGADLRAVFGVPLLSRPAPSRRRHGRHDRARLRDDGRGQPCRDPHRRVPAARARQLDQRPRRGRAARGRADRRARRRAVDGLFVLRSRPAMPLARHLHDPRPHRARAAAWACLTSISAIGCRARARWTTRAASCRNSG